MIFNFSPNNYDYFFFCTFTIQRQKIKVICKAFVTSANQNRKQFMISFLNALLKYFSFVKICKKYKLKVLQFIVKLPISNQFLKYLNIFYKKVKISKYWSKIGAFYMILYDPLPGHLLKSCAK